MMLLLIAGLAFLLVSALLFASMRDVIARRLEKRPLIRDYHKFAHMPIAVIAVFGILFVGEAYAEFRFGQCDPYEDGLSFALTHIPAMIPIVGAVVAAFHNCGFAGWAYWALVCPLVGSGLIALGINVKIIGNILIGGVFYAILGYLLYLANAFFNS